MNKKVICADGFFMSVQANENAYCSPRANHDGLYTEVEIGFPSAVEPLIMPWAEDKNRPRETIYGYVPVGVVNNVIAKHGGVAEGEVPNGVACLKALDDFLVDTSDER